MAGYHAHGAIEQMQFGNLLWEYANYNSRLQPVDLRLGTTAQGWEKWRLRNVYAVSCGGGGECNNGNVQSQTATVGGTLELAQTYGYDWLNRLTSASESGSWAQDYSYDRYGNRWMTSEGGFTPGWTGYRPNGASWYTAENRLSGVGYDGAGNQTQLPPFTLGYDGENRLKSAASASNGSAAYDYDGEGRRVRAVVSGETVATTYFVYDAFGQLAAEYSSQAPEESGRRYVTVDHLGSTRVVTDGSGAVASRHDYLPFGE
ncbi:MAG: hypothetical protein KIT09_23405, partial [Bryobacteraceae bacterium]|nr:hypothetical protein [Bryobacteraceae bacterium]